MSETRDTLVQFANGVDESTTWHFLGASGDATADIYEASVISRGDIPAVTADDFGDLRDFITIETPPEDAETRVHIIHFLGDLVGLEDFGIFLSDKIAYPPTEDDPLSEVNGPALLLQAVIAKRL